MKVTIILSENPLPANSGGKVAILERIKILSKIFKLQLIILQWSKDESLIEELKLYSSDIVFIKSRLMCDSSKLAKLKYYINAFLSSKPKFNYLFNTDSNSKLLQCSIEIFEPDLVLFENIYSTIFLKKIKSKYSLRCVYFAHNVEYQLISKNRNDFLWKLFSFLESYRIKEFEKELIFIASQVVTFTDLDKELLLNLIVRDSAQDYKIIVIPPIMIPPAVEGKHCNNRERTLFMPTNAAWGPNVTSLTWFFTEVYPFLYSDVKIELSGIDKNGFLQDISNSFKNVSYLGLLDRPVYEDKLRKAGAFVNPTICGSGFQIKLLEAVAYDIPTVSTEFSNFLSSNIPSSDDPKVLARHINEILDKSKIEIFDYLTFYNLNERKLISVVQNNV